MLITRSILCWPIDQRPYRKKNAEAKVRRINSEKDESIELSFKEEAVIRLANLTILAALMAPKDLYSSTYSALEMESALVRLRLRTILLVQP